MLICRPGTVVAQLHAIDDDLHENGRVTYELQEDRMVAAVKLFTLDPRTGQLRLRKSIDRVGHPALSAKNHATPNTSAADSNNSTDAVPGEQKVRPDTTTPIPSAYSLFVNVSPLWCAFHLLCSNRERFWMQIWLVKFFESRNKQEDEKQRSREQNVLEI